MKSKHFIRLMRPYQWIKNLLLFSPLFFSGRMDWAQILTVGWATVCFCLTSSLGYILNDWMDRDRDRFHHTKQNRPFSSGDIKGMEGLILVILLAVTVGGICVLSRFEPRFLMFLLLYFLLSVAYSLFTKHIVILELFSVSLGFVLRVLAGGAVSGIVISSWLFLTVFFISMLISVAKRLSEFEILGEEQAVLHRQSQAGYTRSYLQHVLWICGGITLVVYSLYVVGHGGIMVYSVLPASYGVFRFIYLTEQGRGSDPIKALFSDQQLLLTAVIFFVFLTTMIYF